MVYESAIRNRALNDGIPYEIPLGYLNYLLKYQNNKCYYTGIEMEETKKNAGIKYIVYLLIA